MPWLSRAGIATNEELSRPRVRAFHDTLVRHFDAMQRLQRCVEVKLPAIHFPILVDGDGGRLFMCRVADNMNPRIWTQDRELVLRVVRRGLFGVDPELHGGGWLSQALVDSFVYGMSDQVPDVGAFVCPKALEGKCAGRKTMCTAKIIKKEVEHAAEQP